MKKTVTKLNNPLNGEITIPSDKSISHRAIIFSSLANGKSIIKNFSKGQDPLSSLKICQALGINYEFQNDNLIILSFISQSPSQINDNTKTKKSQK